MVQEFWERTTLEQLKNILKQDNNRKFSVTECAILIAELTLDGRGLLQEHIKDYNDILLHIFATDMVTEPLLKLFGGTENNLMINCYISLIEIMWQKGSEEVRNVVDVTILERLSDEDTVWQRFGKLVSSEFKCYVNQELLTTNLMMCGVKPLE